jgi:hypothetical protein
LDSGYACNNPFSGRPGGRVLTVARPRHHAPTGFLHFSRPPTSLPLSSQSLFQIVSVLHPFGQIARLMAI